MKFNWYHAVIDVMPFLHIIHLKILKHNEINTAINQNKNYICSETLAGQLELVDELKQNQGISVELDNDVTTVISIEKLN